MRKILFVTQHESSQEACGVSLIGKQYLDLLRESSIFKVICLCPKNLYDVVSEITVSNPLAVIFNFHPAITPGANVSDVQIKFPHIPFIKIDHDMTQELVDNYKAETNYGFHYCIVPDPTLKKTSPSIFQINRMMAEGSPVNPPVKNYPWIGFQGFGFDHKGIHRIAEQVVKEFNRAILRLHIPYSTVGDPQGHLARKQVAMVKSIIGNRNIIVSDTYHMMSSIELVQWLSQNDVNCYFYDDNPMWGIASAPDYAIAARQPIAVTKSQQLRYIWNNVPTSLIEESSLKNIMQTGFSPYENLYNKMSRMNILHEIEHIIEQIIYIHRI